MQKNYKTMILPIISIVALGIGTLLGLTEAEITSIKDGLETAVTLGFTLYGVIGVIKSHHKKEKKQ